MKFSLTIHIKGSAMVDNPNAVAEALTELGDTLNGRELALGDRGSVMDYNGNTVGEWRAMRDRK